MAILRDGDLSLDITYREFEHESVYYDILLTWRGEPVINDAILKRHNAHWAKRGKGAIKADENRECGILPLLRRVLETNEADFWEPTEPDILIALYPDGSFPFLPSKWKLTYEAPRARAARAELESARKEFGPLPSDLIELILFVDTYNFEASRGYSGTGLCFRLVPTRDRLAAFYSDLRGEYVKFRDVWRIQEKNDRAWGPGYNPSDF